MTEQVENFGGGNGAEDTERPILRYSHPTCTLEAKFPSWFLKEFVTRVTSYAGCRSGFKYETLESRIVDYQQGRRNGRCTCICLDGSICSKVIPCLSWISVKGKDSMCVVTHIEFKGCSLADAMVEVVDNLGEYFARGKMDQAPFAIVSLGLGTIDMSLKDSSDRLKEKGMNEKATVDFLKKKTENKPDLSNEEAIQIAISALQCLLQKNLKADAIRMLSLDLDWFTRCLIFHHLCVPQGRRDWKNKVFSVKEIEKHLAKATDSNQNKSSTPEAAQMPINPKYMHYRPQFFGMTTDGRILEYHVPVPAGEERPIPNAKDSCCTRICLNNSIRSQVPCFATWIAVLGKDYACLVAHGKVPPHLLQFSIHMLADHLYVEKKTSTLQKSELRVDIRPFVVVSFAPNSTGEFSGRTLEEVSSGGGFNEQASIKYLEEKMKDDTVFSYEGTIQTAISGFEYLFQEKFKADDIQIRELDVDWFTCRFIKCETYGTFETPEVSMNRLSVKEVEKHLAALRSF